jgi:hypothetical protein
MNENRSIFWPLTLIAAGVIWLMVSMNQIPAANLWALTHIWPYLLIALGLGLILRSVWKPFGMVVSTLVVVGAALSVVFAPQLGWNDAPDWGWGWNVSNSFTGGVPGSGNVEKVTRKVSDFDTIAIRYPAEIVIRQGASESLTIEAEDNLLPQLATEARSGTLYIENTENDFSQRVAPTEAIKITITVKTLDEIQFSSAGTLTVENLKGDSLIVSLSGAGDVEIKKLDVRHFEARLSGAGKITASGKSATADISISGLGDFEGENLSTLIAEVRISGAGQITLRVEDELTAHVSGAGSVYYYGSPTVTKTISGAGDVSQAGE